VTDDIDVLLIEPSDSDAKKTLAAIRQAKPDASTLRVVDATQASRLMFGQGLFTEAPQMPRLILVDLPAAGDAAKEALLRLRSLELRRPVPIVVFSSQRSEKDILDAHLLGAHLNLQKPDEPEAYAAAVKRIIRTWETGSFSAL
jgi:DNA-binding NarL/FixJ family response regulator